MTPLFIIPDKEGTVRFIMGYCRLNQQLVINTYPLPRIVNAMQKLEGFQYVVVLYINMKYYAIRIPQKSQYMIKIVTGFSKFRYNHIPMGICDLWGIFQANVDELFADIKGFKTYIYDTLVLINDRFSNHIYYIIFIFARLFSTEIKLNYPKYSFGLNDIPYLVYVITR